MKNILKIASLLVFILNFQANAVISEICPIPMPRAQAVPFSMPFAGGTTNNGPYVHYYSDTLRPTEVQCQRELERQVANGMTDCSCETKPINDWTGDPKATVTLYCTQHTSISLHAAQNLICSTISRCILTLSSRPIRTIKEYNNQLNLLRAVASANQCGTNQQN